MMAPVHVPNARPTLLQSTQCRRQTVWVRYWGKKSQASPLRGILSWYARGCPRATILKKEPVRELSQMQKKEEFKSGERMMYQGDWMSWWYHLIQWIHSSNIYAWTLIIRANTVLKEIQTYLFKGSIRRKPSTSPKGSQRILKFDG